MNRLTKHLPHLITAIALLLGVIAIYFYLQNRSTYLRTSESFYLTRGWDEEVFELILQDILVSDGAHTLPCPARVARTIPGKRATHQVTATIARAHIPPDAQAPQPTCDDAPHYLVNMTTGWLEHPRMYDEWALFDSRPARQHPERFRGYGVRRDTPPLTITALPTSELAVLAEALP